MNYSPTVDKTMEVRRHDSSILCKVLYPSNEFTDRETLNIWAGNTYPPINLKEPPKVIVDIGAAWGDSALYFATLYPDAQIYAFEPTPSTFRYLQQNVREFEPLEDRIHIFPIALAHGDQEDEIPLYVGDNTTGGVCNTLAHRKDFETVKVRAVGAARMLRKLGIDKIDILKVDAEGAEAVIFPDLRDYLHNIPVIYFEYHQEEYRRQIDRLLEPTHNLACCRLCGNCLQGEMTYVNLNLVNFKGKS